MFASITLVIALISHVAPVMPASRLYRGAPLARQTPVLAQPIPLAYSPPPQCSAPEGLDSLKRSLIGSPTATRAALAANTFGDLPLPWTTNGKSSPPSPPAFKRSVLHGNPGLTDTEREVRESARNLYLEYHDVLPNKQHRFKLGDELGAGKYGRVWKATDLHATNPRDTHVAVKCSYSIYQTLLEIGHHRDASAGNHPNIVRWIDSFGYIERSQTAYGEEERPVACLVQELVVGYNLEQLVYYRVKGNPKSTLVPVKLVQHILAQVLEALRYVHSLKMAFRDVKANNFIYDEGSGLVKLTDFGLATYLVSMMRAPLPEVTELYGDMWTIERLYMEGYDPFLRNPKFRYNGGETMLDGSPEYLITEVYAFGTLLRSLFTAEPTRIAGKREAMTPDWLRAYNWWAFTMFSQSLPAWDLYQRTREPPSTRLTIAKLMEHPFVYDEVKKHLAYVEAIQGTLSSAYTSFEPTKHTRKRGNMKVWDILNKDGVRGAVPAQDQYRHAASDAQGRNMVMTKN